MKGTILEKIIDAKRARVESAKAETNSLFARAKTTRSNPEPHRFRKALQRHDQINIIAEIKRASPSKGMINDQIDVANMARSYASGGAAAI